MSSIIQMAEHLFYWTLSHQSTKQNGDMHPSTSKLHKSFQRITVLGQQRFIANSLEHGLIVLIHQHHHILSRFSAARRNHPIETAGYSYFLSEVKKTFPVLIDFPPAHESTLQGSRIFVHSNPDAMQDM